MRTLSEMLSVRRIGTPGSYSAQADLTWVNVVGYRRALFNVILADLTADCVFTVKQATDSSGTGTKVLDSTVTATGANGSDESKPGLIEVLTDHLDEGYNYITLNVNPGAATVLAVDVLLGDPYELPASNPSADVAFVVQSAPA